MKKILLFMFLAVAYSADCQEAHEVAENFFLIESTIGSFTDEQGVICIVEDDFNGVLKPLKKEGSSAFYSIEFSKKHEEVICDFKINKKLYFKEYIGQNKRDVRAKIKDQWEGDFSDFFEHEGYSSGYSKNSWIMTFRTIYKEEGYKDERFTEVSKQLVDWEKELRDIWFAELVYFVLWFDKDDILIKISVNRGFSS